MLRYVSFAIATAALAFAAPPTWSASEPARRVAPSGFSETRLTAIDRFYEAKVARGDMAGIVILIARHGRIVHLRSIGQADRESARAMADDTIFRAYSMTKPVAATALMMLYERGLFQLDDPVSKYLPSFAGIRVLKTPASALDDTVAPTRAPTIHDLLRHTAGLGHGWGEDAADREYRKQDLFGLDVTVGTMSDRLAKIPLLYQPGSRFFYSVAPDIEARLVEVLSGLPFDVFADREIFRPLEMRDSGFSVGRARAGRLATVYWRKADKLTPLDATHGYPPDGGFLVHPDLVNSYVDPHPRKGGSYGMVTTATDYWHFAQMLLDGGMRDGKRLLGPRTIALMTRDHLDGTQHETFSKGLGWGLGVAVMRDPAMAGLPASEGTFYWSGAANTHFWVDPKEDLVVVAMAQDMDNPADDAIRQQLMAMVYGALVD